MYLLLKIFLNNQKKNKGMIQTNTWPKWCRPFSSADKFHYVLLGTWQCIYFRLYQLILKTQYKIGKGSPPKRISYYFHKSIIFFVQATKTLENGDSELIKQNRTVPEKLNSRQDILKHYDSYQDFNIHNCEHEKLQTFKLFIRFFLFHISM